MTKQHFEYMAEWIARNARFDNNADLVALATATAEQFNPRFDRDRFVARIEERRKLYGGYADDR